MERSHWLIDRYCRRWGLSKWRSWIPNTKSHYCDVIVGAMASQITSLTIVCSTVYSGADQRKHQSSAWLAFERGIHRWPVNSPHKWPVTGRICFHLMTSSWFWKAMADGHTLKISSVSFPLSPSAMSFAPIQLMRLLAALTSNKVVLTLSSSDNAWAPSFPNPFMETSRWVKVTFPWIKHRWIRLAKRTIIFFVENSGLYLR